MGNAAAAKAALACLLLASLAAASPAVASPAWLAPTDLSAPGRDATEPALAMDEAGETVAVWQRQSETESGQVIQASTRSPGAAFSAPLELSAAASEPAVAMTPSGEAIAVWRHFDLAREGDYVIQAAYRPSGRSFSASVDVAVTPNVALPHDVHVAIDAAGDTAVVWTQEEPGSTSVVRASLRPVGGSFTTPVTISPTPVVSGRSARDPRVAIDAGGEVVAVWTYENGSNDVVQTTRGTAGSGFSSPLELSSSGREAASPAIAISPAGEATAVWTRSNGTDYVVEAATASPGGSFSSPPVELSDPAQSAFEPELAMDPAGKAVVVWTRSNGANQIVEATSGAAGGFASPVALSEPGEDAIRPQVARDRGGATTVVWQRSNGESETVQAATGSAAGFGAPADLSPPGQGSRFPMVAMDGQGDATVVWRSDGAFKVVQAAGYDADAPLLRNVSIPASGMAGVPVSFSAGPFDVWPIAQTVFDFGDGASVPGASVAHTYSAKGAYRVTATSMDAAGTPVSAAGTIAILPSNEFFVGRLSLNRKRGTGSLVVIVPGPGRLVLSGRGVRKAIRPAKRAGRVKLPIGARGTALGRLRRRGRARLALTVSFTPDGGTTLAKHRKVTLIRWLH